MARNRKKQTAAEQKKAELEKQLSKIYTPSSPITDSQLFSCEIQVRTGSLRSQLEWWKNGILEYWVQVMCF